MISIDGAGYQGAVLRELEDPEGLALDAYVPPRRDPPRETFGPEDFAEDREQGKVTCPAGHTSQYHQRDEQRTGSIYRFTRDTCESCLLLRSVRSMRRSSANWAKS